MRYGQEAKAYALMTLAGVAVMWAVAELLSRAKAQAQDGRGAASGWLPWAAYVLGTTVVLYCHNTGLFLPAAANGVVLGALATGLLKSQVLLRRWLAAQAAVLLLWAPWLPSLVSQSRQVLDGYWIPAPSPEQIVYSLRELLWNAELLLVADLLVVALAAWGLLRWRQKPLSALVAGGFLLLPIAGQLLVSVMVQPIFLPHPDLDRGTALPAGRARCAELGAASGAHRRGRGAHREQRAVFGRLLCRFPEGGLG